MNLQDILGSIPSDTPLWQLLRENGSLYLERYVLSGEDCLDNHDPECKIHAFVHRIHTPDADRHMHNHPWRWSIAVVLNGGYTEARSANRGAEYPLVRNYGIGDLNILMPGDYHSIKSVLPDTITLFLAGAETQDWGFLVDSVHIPHSEYFAQTSVHHMTTRQVR